MTAFDDDPDAIGAQDTLPAQGTAPDETEDLPHAPTIPMAAIRPGGGADVPAADDRRRDTRYPASFVVRMRLNDTRQYLRCLSRDVGEGGVLVLMPELPPVGSHVECVMVHPETGGELNVRARVVRHANTLAGRGAGIAFNDLDAGQRARLASFFGLAG